MHIYPCINSTKSNISCASEEQQKKFYDTNFMGIRLINANYDPNNETHPVK